MTKQLGARDVRVFSAKFRPALQNCRGTSLDKPPSEMRKRYRVLMLAALVAGLVVPVGFALSLESPTPVRVASSSVVSVPLLESLPDSAKLFAAGAVLFGLAAFVRKAV